MVRQHEHEESLKKYLKKLEKMKKVIYCPHCKKQHIDGRWWAHRPHKVHNCLYKDCGKKFETKEELIGVKG